MSQCRICSNLDHTLYWSPDGEEEYYNGEGTYIELCDNCSRALEGRFGIQLQDPEMGP